MKIVTIFCAVAATGLIASSAPAQDVHRQTTTTRTVTRVHVDRASPMGINHGRRMAWGHHRNCHMVWRHHHRVRLCNAWPMHSTHRTVVRTKIITH
jgi:hypothetical protein